SGHEPAPSTVVYDRPPGAEPVLHRPREGAAAPLSAAGAPERRREGAAAPLSAAGAPERPALVWLREDTGEFVAERRPAHRGVVTMRILRGTPAEIDRK